MRKLVREEEFKQIARVSGRVLDLILTRIDGHIEKISTNLKPFILPNVRLAMALYRLGHGWIYLTVSDMFGVSIYSIMFEE